MERSRWLAVLGDWLWFLCWAALSSAWCLTVAGEIGATFDEPGDLNNALEFWRTGSHDELLRLGAMPLPMDLTSLPGYLWERTTGESVDFGKGAPYDQLFWARVPILLFWWLLLFYGRLIARNIAGPWAGRLAVALLAVEPTLLAHASLATKDMAITACLAAFVYHYRTGRDAGWLKRIGLPALWFALALLSKASGVVFCPLCMFALETERLARLGAFTRADAPGWRHWLGMVHVQFRPFRRDALQTLGIGMVLVFIYCGSDFQPQQSFVRWADGLSGGPFASTMVWIAHHLCIFRNAGDAIARQVSHNIRGDGVYLLGHVAPVSVWYYFPVCLSMKFTVPLLALPLVVALARPRRLTNWACVAAFALFLFSFQCRVQIGVRLMLPLVGIAIPGFAAAFVNAWRDLRPGLPRHVLTAGVTVGVAWSACAAVTVWPHGLCYVNELYGGTRNGYLQISDANYDWGQGVPELARWQQQHAGSPLDVWYFGTDPAIDVYPFQRVHLHALPLKTTSDVAAALQGRQLAVSTTIVYGSMLNDHIVVKYLRSHTPAARTQTFLIYDFRENQGSE
jgi:hypothetical protein